MQSYYTVIDYIPYYNISYPQCVYSATGGFVLLNLPYLLLLFFFGLSVFSGPNRGIWRFPGQGSNESFSCRSMPQALQCQREAVSVTYTTAHGNAGSLTHWERPEIVPATSWFLVRFISAVTHWELSSLPISFLSPSSSTLETICLFSVSVILLCFVMFVCLVF